MSLYQMMAGKKNKTKTWSVLDSQTAKQANAGRPQMKKVIKRQKKRADQKFQALSKDAQIDVAGDGDDKDENEDEDEDEDDDEDQEQAQEQQEERKNGNRKRRRVQDPAPEKDENNAKDDESENNDTDDCDDGDDNVDAEQAKSKNGTKQVVTKKGVKWIDVKLGVGPQRPIQGRAVKLHYTGYLHYGTAEETVFDSTSGSRKPAGKDQKGSHPRATSKKEKKVAKPARCNVVANRERKIQENGTPPFAFLYGKNKVIRGLEMGIKSMMEGGERIITIPSFLAYGPVGSKRVPPNSELTFVVELLAVGSHAI